MVVLAHLQGVAATFRVGRHHHRGPLYEALGRTHALTDIAPTDLTVAAALVRKAYSKRRRSRLWSKPVNLRTWGLVSDPIVMAQAFAELRYGVVIHTRENSVKYGHNFNQTLYVSWDDLTDSVCRRALGCEWGGFSVVEGGARAAAAPLQGLAPPARRPYALKVYQGS